MNNQQSFVNQIAIALSENKDVKSFSVSFKTLSVNGEDEIVPDLQVIKKE